MRHHPRGSRSKVPLTQMPATDRWLVPLCVCVSLSLCPSRCRMFIRRLQDPIIERIEQRISMATQIPVSHQEDIQVSTGSGGSGGGELLH